MGELFTGKLLVAKGKAENPTNAST
jgi:hypothetical protein